MTITPVVPWQVGAPYGVCEALEISSPKGFLVVGGQVSTDDDGGPLHVGDMASQLDLVLSKIERLLAAAEYEPRHLVQLNFYTPFPDEYFAAMDVYLRRTEDWGVQPTGIFCVPTQLGRPEWMIELTAMAAR